MLGLLQLAWHGVAPDETVVRNWMVFEHSYVVVSKTKSPRPIKPIVLRTRRPPGKLD